MFTLQYGSWRGKQWKHQLEETESSFVRFWRQCPVSIRFVCACVNKNAKIHHYILFINTVCLHLQQCYVHLCSYVHLWLLSLFIFLTNVSEVNDGQKRRRLVAAGQENCDPKPSPSVRLVELEKKPDTPIVPSVRSRVQQITQRRDDDPTFSVAAGRHLFCPFLSRQSN